MASRSDARAAVVARPPWRSPWQALPFDEEDPALTWLWSKGEARTLADFGDPLGGDRYALCIFDESEATPTLVVGAATRVGQCGSKPCWRNATASTRKCADATRGADGLASVLLKRRGQGKASINVAGGGANLVLPPLPLRLPLRAQLQASNGRCWEARYFELGVSKNTGTVFQGKAFRP